MRYVTFDQVEPDTIVRVQGRRGLYKFKRCAGGWLEFTELRNGAYRAFGLDTLMRRAEQ
jgi:hypothetical protein